MTKNFPYSVSIPSRYLVQAPDDLPSADLLVLALHGYGMDAASMLRLTAMLFGGRRVIASLEAPYQFYLRQGQAGSEIGYHWGTRNYGPENIRLHHSMIMEVRRQLEAQYGLGPDRTVLAGFSQPVGFNYRFAATHPGEVAGVIGICGGVPRDWETADYKPVQAALLHIARQEDEFYPAEVTATYAGKLRKRAADVEYHLLPGRHRFPSKGADVVEPWVRRVYGQA